MFIFTIHPSAFYVLRGFEILYTCDDVPIQWQPIAVFKRKGAQENYFPELFTFSVPTILSI